MAQGRAAIKHRVKLTDGERRELEQLIRRGAAGWKLQRAQALLKCDESKVGPGWSDAQIAEAFGMTARSVENWRKQAVERGPLSLLERKAQDRSQQRKLDGVGEAKLVKPGPRFLPQEQTAQASTRTAQIVTEALTAKIRQADIYRERWEVREKPEKVFFPDAFNADRRMTRYKCWVLMTLDSTDLDERVKLTINDKLDQAAAPNKRLATSSFH